MTALYYDRISISEGLDNEVPWENHDNLINGAVSRRCNGCHVVFFEDLNFNYRERVCNRCGKVLLGTDFDPKKIYIIWWNNCKYRVLKTLKCGQMQRLTEKEKPQDRFGFLKVDGKPLSDYHQVEPSSYIVLAELN